MYDVHYFECEYCGMHFDDETNCRKHELNHLYEKAVPSMGHIFIKTDNDDKLKEYSVEHEVYDINTIFVPTSQACDFMSKVFMDEYLNSPWSDAGLDTKPGWYYIDNDNCWHCIEEDIVELTTKMTMLYKELHSLNFEGGKIYPPVNKK